MTSIHARLLWFIVYGDTLGLRLTLAGVAAFWSVGLALPGDTFERPVYVQMALIADEWVWCCAWASYSTALFWRTLAETRRHKWITYVINSAGLLLYGTSTACIIFSKVWPFPAAAVGDLGLTIVAIWILMRSGLNNAPGWRDD